MDGVGAPSSPTLGQMLEFQFDRGHDFRVDQVPKLSLTQELA